MWRRHLKFSFGQFPNIFSLPLFFFFLARNFCILNSSQSQRLWGYSKSTLQRYWEVIQISPRGSFGGKFVGQFYFQLRNIRKYFDMNRGDLGISKSGWNTSTYYWNVSFHLGTFSLEEKAYIIFPIKIWILISNLPHF